MIPRLWIRHFDFPEWRLQHPNILETLGIEETIRFYKTELQLFKNYQEEIINQMKNRQTTLVNQINQLDSYIFDTLTLSEVGIGPKGGRSLSEEQYIQLGLDQSTVVEMVTESGIYLILEDGNVIGPYLGT